MRKIPSLKAAFLHTSIYQVFGMALGFVLSVLLARFLGPMGRGELSILVTTMGMLVPVTLIVTGGNDIIAGGERSCHHPLLMQTLKWVSLVSLIFFIAFVVLAKVKGQLFGVHFYPLDAGLATLYVWMFSVEVGIRSILMARQDFYIVNKLQLLSKVVALVFVLVGHYCFDNLSVREAFMIIVFQQLLVLSGYVLRLPRPITKTDSRCRTALLRKSMSIGKRVFLTAIPTLLLLKVDIILLGAMDNTVTVGVYAVAVSACGFFKAFSEVLNRLIKAKAVSEDGGADRAVLASKIVLILGIVALLPVLWFGESFFAYVYGDEYRQSYTSFVILWGAVTIWGWVSPLAGFAVAKRQYPVEVIVGMNLALLVNIALNLLWIPVYRETGAAMASLVAYGVMSITYVVAFYKVDGRHFLELVHLNGKERQYLVQTFHRGCLWLRRA